MVSREKMMSKGARYETPTVFLYNPIWHRSQCCGVKWGARVLRVRSVSREQAWARGMRRRRFRACMTPERISDGKADCGRRVVDHANVVRVWRLVVSRISAMPKDAG